MFKTSQVRRNAHHNGEIRFGESLIFDIQLEIGHISVRRIFGYILLRNLQRAIRKVDGQRLCTTLQSFDDKNSGATADVSKRLSGSYIYVDEGDCDGVTFAHEGCLMLGNRGVVDFS